MTAPNDAPTRGSRFRLPVLVLALLAVGAAAFGLYENGRPSSKNVAHSGACAKSLDLAQAIDPLIHGEVAALQIATQPNALGAIAFDDADGHKITISSFKGKTVLLNLWATWCVPCRTEMPSLGKLEASEGSKAFSVVPISVDTTRLEKAKGFFKANGVTSLPFYSDSSGDILHAFTGAHQVAGLPTTILIGADGCEIATMAGPAQWDSSDALALIERLKKAEAEKDGAA